MDKNEDFERSIQLGERLGHVTISIGAAQILADDAETSLSAGRQVSLCRQSCRMDYIRTKAEERTETEASSNIA